MKQLAEPLLITAALLVFLWPQASRAQSYTWTGASNGAWATASNWSNGVAVPSGGTAVFGATDTAPANSITNGFGATNSPLGGIVITNTGSYNVGFSGGVIFLGSGGLTSTRSTAGSVGITNNIRATSDQLWNIGTGALVTIGASLYNSGVTGATVNFEKTGAGTLTLVGTNGDIGGTGKSFKISDGVVSIAGNGALGSTNSTLDLNGGTLQTTATFTQTRAVTLSANSTIRPTSGSLTMSNTISGAGGFTKTGAGTLVLATNNTYTGTTTLSEGVLSVGDTNQLGAATNGLAFSGGTLQVTGTSMTNFGSRSVSFTSGADAVFNIATAGNNFLLTNNLAQGAGGLTINSTGGATAQLTLSGSNSGFTGTITVNGGKLNFNGINSVSASNNLVINGSSTVALGITTGNTSIGSLASSSSNAAINTLIGSAGTRTLMVNQDTNTTFAGRLQEDATRLLALTKTGAGTLTLSGSNTYTGSTVISNGTLRIGNGSDAGSIATTVAITNDGALVYNVGAGVRILGAPISGTGSLTQDSAGGSLILSGTNTYTGNTTVNAGTLALATNGSLRFVIGGSGTNNSISGTGTTVMNGQFALDLTSASTNTNATWTIVAGTLTNSYGTNFLVTGFNGAGGNWTNTTNGVNYVFTQSNSVLAVQSTSAVTPYTTWVSYWQGIDPGFTNTAGTDNPDGDPFDNNEEFSFDGNPTVGTAALLTATKSGTNVVFNYVAMTNTNAVTYLVQSTTNLSVGPWASNSVTVSNSSDQSGISQTNIYVRKEFVVPGTNNDFYRVRATIAP